VKGVATSVKRNNNKCEDEQQQAQKGATTSVKRSSSKGACT
jgi:hypothetical protein